MKRFAAVVMSGAFPTLTLSPPFPAPAGEIGSRQKRQPERIQQGIEPASLTPAEATKLEAEQARIQRPRRRFRRNDGRLGPTERAEPNTDLSQACRHIYTEHHD